MLHRSRIAVLLAATTASPALAQSMPGNTSMTGWVELEYFSNGDTSEIVFAGDETLKLRPDALQGFGLDIGVLGTEAESFVTSAYYAALVMPLAGGELSVGVPRSALREIFQMPVFGGAQTVNAELGAVTDADFLTSVYLLSDAEQVGLRYDNTYGTTRVSAGYYVMEQEINVLQLAVEQGLSHAKLRFGLESVSGDGNSLTNLVVGGTASFGQFDMSAMLRHMSGSDIAAVSVLRLDGVYHVNDTLALTASYLTMSEDVPDFIGLSVAYDITKITYLQGGVLASDGETAFDLSVGLKF